MGHRGRHRRRRRGRALRAGLAGTALALTAAATMISASQAVGGDNPGPLKPLTSASELGRLQLHENLVSEKSLDTLTDQMGGNVSVDGVLRSANHSMRNEAACSGTEREALPVEPAASRAYCWDTRDATTGKWLPRSVATSDDDADGLWGDDRVVLSGWTHNDDRAGEPEADKGLARVAFIDANDPDDLKYRWVLLVAPLPGGHDFGAVRSDIGGMVWYQDKLIVTAKNGADHDNALFVFDMHHILQTDVKSGAIGRVRDGWSAHGYEYVLPAVGSYNLTGGACTASDDSAVPCFGSISLDRTSTPNSLVAGEWSAPGDTGPARLWRYHFSTALDRTGLLGATSGGIVDADEAYETEASGLRGVISHKPNGASEADWYVDQAPGDRDKHGTLWRQNEGGADAARCTADRTNACWGRHTESMSYAKQTGELWTLTQRTANQTAPGRVLYTVPLSAVANSMD
ncbi:hypothetical protein ACFS5L_37795 [Streptomyces phyllanthi]|uniref:Secreted protein n=1 Tax=Streptomyces phyllanthi TaxID=1803180 RepID=A0A5N8W4E3_9ACTN|nr:hypothetical protein [Streptomyces phyllanthi]MPY42361.1 hypothetical protein [Streptomyces phyllanthi]